MPDGPCCCCAASGDNRAGDGGVAFAAWLLDGMDCGCIAFVVDPVPSGCCRLAKCAIRPALAREGFCDDVTEEPGDGFIPWLLLCGSCDKPNKADSMGLMSLPGAGCGAAEVTCVVPPMEPGMPVGRVAGEADVPKLFWKAACHAAVTPGGLGGSATAGGKAPPMCIPAGEGSLRGKSKLML